ncbi:MAG TPA: entericidin [Opitutaceae bacterium]
MKTLLKRFLLFFLAAGFTALVVTGCQTAKGLGRDVENLGEKIQNP